MAEYRLSPAAQRDLNGIFDYTATSWSLEQAVQYTGIIRAACTRLAATPLSGVQCETLRRGYRFFAVGQHRIYFKPTPYGIAVIRILHQRMDVLRHL
jgi:toxin ParE1/3/4